MFKINDTIIYGSEGVCQIVDIKENDFLGGKRTYYVIKPMGYNASTIYVPVDSELLVQKMHSLLSKNEINDLIDSLPKEPTHWIPNERERKEKYKELLSSGNRAELLNMIRTVHNERIKRESLHKRLHMIDEHFLNDAEKCLYSEFQFVLKLKQDEVISYIMNRVESNSDNT